MSRLSHFSKTDLAGGILAGVLATVLGLLIWWPIRFLPYHHTSATNLMIGTEILLSRNLTPPALFELELANPPILQLLLAGISSQTPLDRPLVHGLMVPLYMWLGIGLYFLVKRDTSASVALVSTALVLVMPIVVNQFQLVSSELLALSLWVATLLAWRRHGYIAVGLAAASLITKPELIFGLLALLLLPSSQFDTLKVRLRVLLAAILPLLLWYWYYYDLTGVIITHSWPEYPSPVALLRYVLGLSRLYLFTEGRWIVSLPVFAAVGMSIYWRKFTTPTTLLGYMVMALMLWVAILLTGSVELSELLVPLTLLVVSGSIAIFQVFSKLFSDLGSPLSSALLLVMVVLQLPLWWQAPPSTGYWFRPFTNLSYQHIISTGRQVAAYLSTEYGDASIYGGYPESYQLTQPILGYVEKPMNFSFCAQFEFNNQENVVIFHRYHQTQLDCAKLRDRYVMVPLERFVSGGYAVELYTVTGESSSSALEK